MVTGQITAPYGSWRSPITAAMATVGHGWLADYRIAADGDDLYVSEMRPAEGGRHVVMRREAGGFVDVTPACYNVRTRVHEYGGGAWTVAGGTVFFSNYADQRLYRQDRDGAPRPLTPEAPLRYADGVVDARRRRLVCVREDHGGAGEPVNTIAAVDLDGGREQVILLSGATFYASPRVSPNGGSLLWLSWDHPAMPFESTELWVGELAADGTVGERQRIAGGPGESVFQPEWGADGSVFFVSDRSGWWNLYRWHEGQTEALAPREAEFGLPMWVFGQRTYAIDGDRITAACCERGTWRLVMIGRGTGAVTPVEAPYTEIVNVTCAGGRVFFAAASPTEGGQVLAFDPDTGLTEPVYRPGYTAVDAAYISRPEPVEFPTSGGLTAHAFFYPPRNPDCTAPPGTLPPLLVKSHGGPTAAATTALDLEIQYWTSRGIAVVDVNYGGSTGYGREYRRRLDGRWGIVDVDDCVNAARYLAAQGRVDGGRMAIDGGSAGGYTTLAALTFRQVFQAGASYYGVSDAEALARDTHKFESRYLDGLVGPYPERRDLYLERSPIQHTDRLSCPLILFQGLEDEIVPPAQSRRMFEAVRAKGLPAAYIEFEGEQHGFRKAENIRRALEAEFYFFSRVFAFEPADEIEPAPIENM